MPSIARDRTLLGFWKRCCVCGSRFHVRQLCHFGQKCCSNQCANQRSKDALARMFARRPRRPPNP